MTSRAYTAAQIFDGERLHRGKAVILSGGQVSALADSATLPPDMPLDDLGDVILAPGFLDLQVNGGGGVMLNDDPSADAIRTICAAHRPFGTTALLPTLITDTPDITAKAVAAAIAAQKAGVPGFAGLHLEGPHLSVRRHGAHDPALIRPMDDTDLTALLRAKDQLQTLLTTVAAESVTPEQIGTMGKAGIIVSLGHTDCSYDTAMRCFEAGASMVTHLFNAMSQLGNREPGVVGAALASGKASAGLIADGFHVHPASMSAALRAKRAPAGIFLVTDAMATVGSDISSFMLNGRQILREGGRLTLADGTLAGADIDMLACVRTVQRLTGIGPEQALAMATSIPSDAIGRADLGRISIGKPVHLVAVKPDFSAVHRIA